MKRSSELAVLSREHHIALELALRLQRASVADADRVRDAALEFWRTEGAEHFRLEEELLLPPFVHHVGAADADVVRVLAEHREISDRITRLESAAGPSIAALNALGEALRDHVRHEERTLFGRIEATLRHDELVAVGAALHHAGDDHRPARA